MSLAGMADYDPPAGCGKTFFTRLTGNYSPQRRGDAEGKREDVEKIRTDTIVHEDSTPWSGPQISQMAQIGEKVIKPS